MRELAGRSLLVSEPSVEPAFTVLSQHWGQDFKCCRELLEWLPLFIHRSNCVQHKEIHKNCLTAPMCIPLSATHPLPTKEEHVWQRFWSKLCFFLWQMFNLKQSLLLIHCKPEEIYWSKDVLFGLNTVWQTFPFLSWQEALMSSK